MSFGKKKVDGSCRRRIQREQVMLAGSAMSLTRSRSVMIADLSADGAQIGGRDLPAPGDEVLLVAGSVDRMGKVMWQRADRCGVRVDQPLQPESIARMKQEAAWDSVVCW